VLRIVGGSCNLGWVGPKSNGDFWCTRAAMGIRLCFHHSNRDDRRDEIAVKGGLFGRCAEMRDNLASPGIVATSPSLLFGAEGTTFFRAPARGLRSLVHAGAIYPNVLQAGSIVARVARRGLALLPVRAPCDPRHRPDVSGRAVYRHGAQSR